MFLMAWLTSRELITSRLGVWTNVKPLRSHHIGLVKIVFELILFIGEKESK